ncbi:uncharacterized protein LOC125240437 [Leguminivora glycinivorella]|uniref:uncharacterized protein LOC125240437 n=1 Tax=Leguminivora glycinivorella TaxID=1035111 RepID=UPI00200BA948|nr:uncharacterized protein LOC125240437 [Leguminivora glycinivorella]
MRTGFPNTCENLDIAQDLRKTYNIDVELNRLKVDIAALQETRIEDEGSLREAHYTFYWKGKSSTETREHGVGFAVRNQLIDAIETPVGVSERIMVLRLNTKSGYVTLISAYAPTLHSTSEAKDQFYNQLDEVLRGVRPSDRLHILGDFNARVGQDNTDWPDCLGAHGVGKLNDNGQRLLEFCSKYELCVTNTFFKGKWMRKVSWMHPRSKHWHQLDLALTRRRDLRETLHTRTYHSADCDTDHSLVSTKVRLVPKRIHSAKPLGRKRINLFKTRDLEAVELFSAAVRDEIANWDSSVSAQAEWEMIKSLLTDAAGRVFGYQKARSHDWMLENEEHLLPLINLKRQALINFRLNPCDSAREELKKAKASLQRSSRFYANAYWTELCQGIQASADAGNMGGVYEGIKRALGPPTKKTAPLKEADGSVITNSSRQMARWVEHYTGLYSCPVDIQPETAGLMPTLDTWHELDSAPTVEELYLAVKQLKHGKSPGKDEVYTEIVKLKCILPVLHNHLTKCWEQGCVPQDMRDANVVTLYKGKGDRGDCNNYRGISLLSIVGKAFARATLAKLQKLADRVYPEAQCGFRAQRSTVDMIFSLRQLQEKCREQSSPLIVAFVDLNKAFDTVSREGLYSVLVNIGCPPKLLKIVQSFHEGMEATILHNCETSAPFDVRRGVRQGCVLAPTLFGIFFSVLLKVAFGDDLQGIHLYTRADGQMYNLARLKSKRHRKDFFVDSLLFADDAAFVAHSESQLQTIMDKFQKACDLFSMSVNAKKTVILAQGCSEQPTIVLNGAPLEVISKFCYLGSLVSCNLSLDAEIDSRIGKAATTFGRLRTRAWDNKHLTCATFPH